MAGLIVKVNTFEGPFELLFHLIEKNEMDIYDIPVAQLTDQYMEYINGFEKADMDGMSEFVLMAATLLEIKSEMLLPKIKTAIEDEGDPRQKLTEMLLEYKRFKEISEIFKGREADAGLVFFKMQDIEALSILKPVYTSDIDGLLGNITIEALKKVFFDVMKRRELSEDKIRSGFGTVNLDKFTVDEKIRDIQTLLGSKKKVFFSGLLLESSCQEEVVVTFCAVLELIKMNKIVVSQRRNFADILIEESIH